MPNELGAFPMRNLSIISSQTITQTALELAVQMNVDKASRLDFHLRALRKLKYTISAHLNGVCNLLLKLSWHQGMEDSKCDGFYFFFFQYRLQKRSSDYQEYKSSRQSLKTP